jgi:presequence protease
MNINDVIHGFKLISIRDCNDVKVTMYEFEHIKSKGKLVYLSNDDTNASFAIGFKTLPFDHTGVCHIIEHSVLCGSKKYPLKEPFVNLLKTSLSTFLNAFTASDWTMYPFASQTPKDYDNILSIYLDAVFNPISMVNNKPFLQEGWHLELMDEDSLPCYKGVVYNEMKGATSGVDEQLAYAMKDIMFKDTPYHWNSGGDPEYIPTLTYKQYCDFYKSHYVPSNALCVLYGQMDIEKRLKFIDKYYSKYDYVESLKIVPQKPHINLDYQKEYALGQGEELNDNTYFSLCYRLADFNNQRENIACSILFETLLSDNDSPLKKALLDANMGQDISYSLDDNNITTSLTLTLEKSNPEMKEKFKKVFESEVKKFVDNGIDKNLLLASINYREFKSKELDMGGISKGILLAMNMMGSFNYDGDLIDTLEFQKHYDFLKEALKGDYFEKLLEKYILNSNHVCQVTLVPSLTLEQEKAEKMNKLMKDTKDHMSKDEIKALVQQTKDLIAYQEHVDTKEEIALLPSLKLKDIPSKVNYISTKKTKIGKYKGIYHDISSNNIAYVNLHFGLKNVPYEELKYIHLFEDLFLNCSTSKHSSLELTSLIKTYLGSFSFAVTGHETNDHEPYFYLTLSTSALNSNISYIPSIVNEVINETIFDKKNVKQVLTQIVNVSKQKLIQDGTRLATDEAKACYSYISCFSANIMSGVNAYHFYKDLLDNFNYAEIKKHLNALKKAIFIKQNLLISYSINKECEQQVRTELEKFDFRSARVQDKLVITLNKVNKKAIVIPSEVSYNVVANDLSKYGKDYNGYMSLISHICTYDYLWNNVRVKGGAYGTSMSVTKTNLMALTSYRDPNVEGTYKTYKELPDYLKSFKVDDNDFKNYIIGCLGGFDAPLSPSQQATFGDNLFFNHTSKKDRENTKKEIINASIEDINNFGELASILVKEGSQVTIGNKDKISLYDFDEVITL